MKDRRDLPLEIEDQMIDIDQTPEIEIGEKEALRNHPDNLHIMTQRAEVTDPLPRADSRGILLVKVTEGEILREEVAGILLEMVAADHNLQTGPGIHPSLTTEDPPTVPVTAIIVGMGKRKIEIEVRVEEGLDKLRKVKI